MKFGKLARFIIAAVTTAFVLSGPTVAAPGGMITWGKPLRGALHRRTLVSRRHLMGDVLPYL